MGDQHSVTQRQDMLVAFMRAGGGRAFLAGGKGGDDFCMSGPFGGADGGGQTRTLQSAGKAIDDGCMIAEQDTQHIAFNCSVKTADDGLAIRQPCIGPVLHLQDNIAGAGLGTEKGDRP